MTFVDVPLKFGQCLGHMLRFDAEKQQICRGRQGGIVVDNASTGSDGKLLGSSAISIATYQSASLDESGRQKSPGQCGRHPSSANETTNEIRHAKSPYWLRFGRAN
jgi:hypothetical protein